MRLLSVIGICAWAAGSRAAASQIPPDHYLWGPPASAALAGRQATSTTSRVADAACTNGPNSRRCWSSGFSIATDFDAKSPSTGNTVTYDLELVNATCSPDGYSSRPCMLFNNMYPGPVIRAKWGDTVVVNLKNSLQNNGTGIHWHGVRQLNTNSNDGTGGLTECPLAPGETKTYTFKCTQFGTSWYHSHFSAQYGEGAAGPIVIEGPASANYDVDLGSYTLGDWFYRTAFEVGAIADANIQKGQPPPAPDTILVNGTNKNAGGSGSYGRVTLTAGKRYRLRLINISLGTAIRVSLDNHPFTVIESDFVPIVPYSTESVLLGIGMRHDVVFTANQTTDNYWFRAEAATECGDSSSNNGLAVFSYSGAGSGDPTSSAFTVSSPTCQDEPEITPYVSNTVPSTDFASQVKDLEVDLTETQLTTNNQSIVVWGVNMSAIDVSWEKPTLSYVMEKNTSYPSVLNLLELPVEGIWTYWIIQETAGTAVPIPHPIHLHGHDFYVLGHRANAVFDRAADPDTLNFRNPPRRDVTFLPAAGWVAIAFPTDNPGAWLLHCHIAWHVAEGLGVQFLEAPDAIPDLPASGSAWEATCDGWRSYVQSDPVYGKSDSGL